MVSGLGGAVLGQAGLGAFGAGGILGGAGLEGAPDGPSSAEQGNASFDFTSGLPSSMVSINSMTPMTF